MKDHKTLTWDILKFRQVTKGTPNPHPHPGHSATTEVTSQRLLESFRLEYEYKIQSMGMTFEFQTSHFP